jgi:NhaP-type Na+/H+ or K+/H+ antiporter
MSWRASLRVILSHGSKFAMTKVLQLHCANGVFSDWFRQETLDDSLQPTIDMLLNVTVFIWFGALCPWHSFAHNSVIPIYRLIFLGILVLLLRRPPVVLLMHKHIRQIEGIRHAAFVGFFGPIGVSAIFYLYVTLEYLRLIEADGIDRPDVRQLAEVMMVVIWFLVVCSIVSCSTPQSSAHFVLLMICPGCPRSQYSSGESRFLHSAHVLTSHVPISRG